MGSVTDQFNHAFRDFALDGVPTSGLYEVNKAEVRKIGPIIEQGLESAVADAEAAASSALLSATAAQGFCNTLPAPAAALPFEVTAVSGGIGTGTGGTPGTYRLGATGGPAGFRASVVIGSDGKIASYDILNPGIASTNAAPTLSLSGVTGLTGATTPTATVATVPAGRVFLAPSSDTTQLLAWINNAGSLSRFPTSGTPFGYPTGDFLSTVTGYAAATTTLDTGAFYSRTTGARNANALYQALIYNVVGADRGYRATSTLGGGSTASLAVFFSGANASGSVLGYQSLPDNADHVNEVLTLPNGTASIVINSLISGLVPRLDRLLVLDGIMLTQQAKAAVRAQTRADLQALGTIAADFGNTATVHGFSVSGDHSPVRYKRGSGVFPTSNGWGLDPAQSDLPALAFGITSPRDTGLYGFGFCPEYAPAEVIDTLQSNVEDYVSLPSSGIYVLRGQDAGLVHLADLAAGQTLEIACANIPLARTFPISVVNENHNGKIILDAGFGSTWGDFGTRFLQVNPGTKISISRLNLTTFAITALGMLGAAAAPSGIAQGSYSPVVRAASMWFGGQSLLDLGFGRGNAHGAFAARLAALGGPASVHTIDCAYGGSAICERDRDDSGSTNYWVDMTNPASPADGPNLTAAIAQISSKGGDSSQPAIAFGLWDQGQQSSTYVDSPENPNANFTKAMYKTATQYALTRLRTASGNSSLKIGLQVIGRRTGVSSSIFGRMQVIRDAQLEMAAADANLFLLGTTWDLTLRDAVHPDDFSMTRMGERTADEVAKVIYTRTGMINHPTINSATFNSTRNSIDVVIRTGAGGDRIYLVSNPIGFRVLDASGVEVPIVASYWTGNTLTGSYQEVTLRLFLNGSASGGTLYHVPDYVPGFDPLRAIRTYAGLGAKALRSAKITL